MKSIRKQIRLALCVGVLSVIGAGCAGENGPEKQNSKKISAGETFIEDRNGAILEELATWYTEAGLAEGEVAAMENLENAYFSEFLATPATQIDIIGDEPQGKLLQRKYRHIYGDYHPAEADFLDWYESMMGDRYVLEKLYLSGEEVPTANGGYTVITWEYYLGALEYSLSAYTTQLRNIFSEEEFAQGFGRLGSTGNLFGVLRLDAATPLKPADEANHYLFHYDLIPQCAFVENCLPPDVRKHWDQVQRQEGE